MVIHKNGAMQPCGSSRAVQIMQWQCCIEISPLYCAEMLWQHHAEMQPSTVQKCNSGTKRKWRGSTTTFCGSEGGGYVPWHKLSAHVLGRCMIFLGPSGVKGGGYMPRQALSAHELQRCIIFLGPSAVKGGRYMLWHTLLAHVLGRCMIFLGQATVKEGGYMLWQALLAHVLGRCMIFLG